MHATKNTARKPKSHLTIATNGFEIGQVHRAAGIAAQCYVEYEMSGEFMPYEPRTRDYPGSPAHFEGLSVEVTLIRGYRHDWSIAYEFTAAERPDWFSLISKIVAKMIPEEDIVNALWDEKDCRCDRYED